MHEDIQDLLVLDTRDIMETTVSEDVRHNKSLGDEQYTEIVEERLELCTKTVKTLCTRTCFHSSVGHIPSHSQSRGCCSQQ